MDWEKNYPLVNEITEEGLEENSSIKKQLNFIGENKRVIDFGCATGYLAQLLKRNGCIVIGIEVNPIAAKVAEQHCEEVFVIDLDFVSISEVLAGQQFDVAVFGDVLEHLRNPWKVLEETRKLLKPDGYVVASIPNIAHGAVRLALLKGKFDYEKLGLLDNTHLRFFTKDTVVELFEQSGYFIDDTERTKLPIFTDKNWVPQVNKDEFDPKILEELQQEEDIDTLQFVVKAFPLSFEGRYAALNARYNLVNEQIYELKSHLKFAQQQIDDYKSDLQQTQTELERTRFYLEEAFQNAKTEREQYQAEQERYQSELKRTQFYLQEALQNAQTERDRFQTQLQQAQTERDHFQTQLQQAQTERDRFQAQLQQAQTEHDHFQAQLQQAQTEHDHFQAQLQQTHTELERTQFYLQETFQNIQAERESYQVQLQQLQAELEGFRNEGIKATAKRTIAKTNLKVQQAISIFKNEGFISLLKKFKKKITLNLPKTTNFSRKDFWNIVNPVLANQTISAAQHPFISIITPTWNSSLDWFVETVLSVLNQSIPDWEWCIVDDGSTKQEIRDVLADLKTKDPRIKVIFQESGGISAATNTALNIAQGDYVCFLDHDDTLVPDALLELKNKLQEGFDVVYSDEDKIDYFGRQYVEPFFKPDWSPEYFRGVMYVGHLLCIRREIALSVGGLNKEYDGVQDYEFMLRVSEVTRKIGHIPKILYHWRKIQGSIAANINAKPRIEQLQQAAVNAHIQRIGLAAKAEKGAGPHRVKLVPLPKAQSPLISIIIPTKDAPEYLARCLQSIYSLSTYPNYEVILVDNETTDPQALEIMKKFPVQRVALPNPFNYSRANNLGVKAAQGDYLVFLNNDTEVVTTNWLENLLYYAEASDIGAVGCLLLFPDQTVQHAGVVMGFRGTADHVMRNFPSTVDGYAGSLVCAREVSAVTAACMMVKKSDFDYIGGFNEHFFTHYQDVDLCMRLIKEGKRNIYTPQAVLIHYESKTRKAYYDIVDRMLLLDQWQDYIDNSDPFYNPNFDIAYYDYTIKA